MQCVADAALNFARERSLDSSSASCFAYIIAAWAAYQFLDHERAHALAPLIATLAIRELAQGLVHRLQHIDEPAVVDALAGPLCLAYVAIGMAGWPTGSSLRVEVRVLAHRAEAECRGLRAERRVAAVVLGVEHGLAS
jgi:hypothetical protein